MGMQAKLQRKTYMPVTCMRSIAICSVLNIRKEQHFFRNIILLHTVVQDTVQYSAKIWSDCHSQHPPLMAIYTDGDYSLLLAGGTLLSSSDAMSFPIWLLCSWCFSCPLNNSLTQVEIKVSCAFPYVEIKGREKKLTHQMLVSRLFVKQPSPAPHSLNKLDCRSHHSQPWLHSPGKMGGILQHI